MTTLLQRCCFESRFMWVCGAVLLGTESLHADCFFTADFETNTTPSWTINGGPSDESANFFFDYSTVGIPQAPNSQGRGTHGMKLQCNLSGGIFSGFSVSPTGQSFTGNYVVKFDWWANFNGPFPGGGSGSANLSTFGIGTVGNTPQWQGANLTLDCILFGATGDGNSASDYRACSSAAPTGYASGSAVYAAPTTNNSDPYYGSIGNVFAPPAQLAIFDQQTGNTNVGAAGMQWHEVEIRKSGVTVTWRIDGLLIASINLLTVTLSGNNIFFGHADINASSSTDPDDVNLIFTLIDNVRVGSATDSCGPCLADIVSSDTFLPPGDGVVDGADLAYLLSKWGACN